MTDFEKWLDEKLEENKDDDSRVRNGAYLAFLAVKEYINIHHLQIDLTLHK